MNPTDRFEVVIAIGLGVGVAVGVAAVRYWWVARRTSPLSCGACGYAVEGAAGLTCSECGADFRKVGITPAGTSPRHSLAISILWGLVPGIVLAALLAWLWT
jgi:hypothetical protein